MDLRLSASTDDLECKQFQKRFIQVFGNRNSALKAVVVQTVLERRILRYETCEGRNTTKRRRRKMTIFIKCRLYKLIFRLGIQYYDQHSIK